MYASNCRCGLGAPALARAHPRSGRRTLRRAPGDSVTPALPAAPPVARRDTHTTVQSGARLAAVAGGIVDVLLREGAPALDQEKDEAGSRTAA